MKMAMFKDDNGGDEATDVEMNIMQRAVATTKSECVLAAALLTLFFYGNMTQKCFNMLLKLVNIISAIKVPTTYDRLLPLLAVKNEKILIDYKKRFYCETFYKSFDQSDRFQRGCTICKSM